MNIQKDPFTIIPLAFLAYLLFSGGNGKSQREPADTALTQQLAYELSQCNARLLQRSSEPQTNK